MNRAAIALLLALGLAACGKECQTPPPAAKAAPAPAKPAQSVFPVLFPKNAIPTPKPPPAARAGHKVAKPVKAAPKAKLRVRAISPDECAKISAAGRFGRTIDDVKAASSARGHAMTAGQIRQAKDCLKR